MWSVVPGLFAGLGLFFMGMYFLTEHLKVISGRRFRQRIARLTRKPLHGVLWGGIFIALTQSTSATTFILISMIRSGMITVLQALPVIVGTNMMAGVIVLLFAFDIQIAVLFVLGVAGMAYTSARCARYRNFTGAVFGIGLIFMGLHMMQTSVAPMADTPYLNSILITGHQAWLYGFLAGGLLAVIMQSSLAVVVMTIAFQQAGIFSMNDSIMIIYGANTGSSVLTMILSSNLTGTSKQVAMFQTAYNIAGAMIFVPLFYIECYGGVPLVRYFAEQISGNIATRVAVVNLVFNFVPGLLFFCFLRPVASLLARLWPETEEEQASKPRYLHDQAIDDPSGAFELIELEQIRLLKQLSRMFNILRNWRSSQDNLQLENMKDAFMTLSATVREAIAEVPLRHRLPPEGYGHLDHLLNMQHAIETIREEISGFAATMERLCSNDAGQRFARAAIEAMDAILMTLIEVASDGSEEFAELLAIMTSDEGESVSGVRDAYLNQNNELDRSGKMQLLAAANHCERLVWLFGDMGRHYMEHHRTGI